MICEVIVDIKNNQVNRSFDYLIPKYLEDFLEIGHRVKVPFGRRSLLGFVIKIKDDTDYDLNKIKEITDVLDLSPLITKEFIDLALFMSKYYFTFYINCLEVMIPSALKVRYKKNIKVLNKENLSDTFKSLFVNKDIIPFTNDLEKYFKEIKEYADNGSLEIIDIITDKGNKKTITMVTLNDLSIPVKSKQGNNLISYLEELEEDIHKLELQNDMGYSSSVINTLVKNGVLALYEKEVYRTIGINKVYDDERVILNDEQEIAFNRIKENLCSYKEFLLHGVTGSGKTEVYLNLMEECLNNNKEAIMLVPEISLTPQMVYKVKSRFGDNVAIFHSRLTINEKYDEWRKVNKGEVKIVIGARSAIFAPFKNLGIIIIDEEHESSYKQDVNPKYDAYMIAKTRAKTHNAILLLGSATPSVETYYKTQIGEIELVELKKRANNLELPKTYIVDMRHELKKGNKSIFSKDLEKAIRNTLLKKEQAILFLNRRGYSSFVMCRECGEVIKCPHCDVTLTFHQFNNKLKCHYCGYDMPNVTNCPSCQSYYIRFVGGGTQKIEAEIIKILPEARVLRVDTDTTTKKNATEIMFEQFKNQEVDILVGTQIIAKGLDFPNVTLVGVLNADMGLRVPIYDAFEKTYDIIEQVSGRAGRDEKPGLVYIQTYNSENYAIINAANHDYHKFYETEINNRKMANNPPFTEIVEVIVSSQDSVKAKKEIKIIQKNLSKNKDIKIFGPTEHSIFKVNDFYRYVLTVKFFNSSLEILEYINEIYQNKKDIYLTITRM